MKIKNISLLGIILISLICVVLVLESSYGVWANHLRSDTDGFYYSRANYFIENGNLTGLGYNEYQPGAVLFFLLPSPLLLINNNVDLYRAGLFAINIILIIVISILLLKYISPVNILIFALILLFAGPIVLHRFELYVALLLISAIFLWKKGMTLKSVAILGAATATKIFPIILLPYLLILIWRNKGVRSVFIHAVVFIIGITVIAGGYSLAFKVNGKDLVENMSIHSQKPVHIESLWGTLLTIYSRITTGAYARGRGDLGIFGIDPNYVKGPLNFYNYFWMIPMSILYLVIFIRSKKQKELNIYMVMGIIALFLSLSKILTPQYIFWFAFLFPLIPITSPKDISPRWSFLFGGILLICFLSQYIYPLRYNELLGIFYESGRDQIYFWLLACRNIAIAVIAGVTLKIALQKPKKG